MRRLASAAVALSAAWVVVGWPRPAPAACEDVRDLRIDGNYDRARREAKACLERHPRRITPLMELSRIHAAQGRVDRALEYVERALDRAPDVPAYRFWRIELLLRSRQLDRARRALGALPEDVASRPRALKLRGKFELWRKNYRGALRYLNRYLQKRPESPRALYYRGISREKTSRWSGRSPTTGAPANWRMAGRGPVRRRARSSAPDGTSEVC
ncbi:MAG: tetratricopeptide repeat protein [Bradymonadaceae bacterium]